MSKLRKPALSSLVGPPPRSMSGAPLLPKDRIPSSVRGWIEEHLHRGMAQIAVLYNIDLFVGIGTLSLPTSVTGSYEFPPFEELRGLAANRD